MKTALTAANTRAILARLSAADLEFSAAYPGDPVGRQPVHTVYGGAHLFRADIAARLGSAALQSLAQYAPDFASFARAIGLAGAERLPAVPAERLRLEARMTADIDAVRRAEPQAFLAHIIHSRLLEKLEREPVEDFRIDFEGGYGNRSDAEEDGHAAAAAEAVAEGMASGGLPPFLGIRIKPLTQDLRARGMRTLDLFLGALLQATHGALPPRFVVTLPKVVMVEQVGALAAVLELLEAAHPLAPGALRMEIMVESPQCVIGADGSVPLRRFVAAGNGRCRGVHLGVHDDIAGVHVTALPHGPAHPAEGLTREVVQTALAGSGVTWSDGASMLLPVPPHRAPEGGSLTAVQLEHNRKTVHGAWRSHYEGVRRALREGCYQGWDLHPALLLTRHAAVTAFFLEGREEAGDRLKRCVEQAAQPPLAGGALDDAATAQGLLDFFRRGISCGALTEAEALATGLTPPELQTRDFAAIVRGRAAAV